MPDAESETRACPYCKEEVNAAAVRCKNCLADIAAMRPDHGGVCPLCREEIKADAIRCYHCKATLVPGARFLLGRVRRPARITMRRPVDDPVELGGGRRGLRPGELPVSDRASADRASGGCADSIISNGVLYDLVDVGIMVDERGATWHVCGYEPHISSGDDG
jgi:hypothetical protein